MSFVSKSELTILSKQLRDCLIGKESGLFLVYQPIYELGTMQISRWESLIRWNHPSRGILFPERVLQILSPVDGEQALFEWVLDEALATIASLGCAARAEACVSVNMSATLLHAKIDLTELIGRQIERHGVAPNQIEIEITETVAFQNDTRSQQCFQSIQALGIKIALDDFGAGYAGLGELRDFRFDRIKLDQGFIRTCPGNARSTALLRSIAALSDALDTPLTIEGIETPEQLDITHETGCREGQGYLLGAPVSRDVFEQGLLAHKTPSLSP